MFLVWVHFRILMILSLPLFAYLCNEARLTHFGDSCAIFLIDQTGKTDLLTELSFFVWQMTTAIAIEDVRREVKLLKSLSGHKHLIRYYDACEDANNVYIVMEYVFVSYLDQIFDVITSSGF